MRSGGRWEKAVSLAVRARNQLVVLRPLLCSGSCRIMRTRNSLALEDTFILDLSLFVAFARGRPRGLRRICGHDVCGSCRLSPMLREMQRVVR